MSRGKKRIERKILPDARYRSITIAKFINIIMDSGKKEVAEKIVYSALKQVEQKLQEKYGDVAKGFNEVILSLGPTVQTKVRRIGGANYQVPVEVPEYRRILIGMKILKKVSRKKKGVYMALALAKEILEAIEEKGDAYKEKITIQKMALANKAYAHLA